MFWNVEALNTHNLEVDLSAELLGKDLSSFLGKDFLVKIYRHFSEQTQTLY